MAKALNILVADDEKNFREMLSELLETWGHRVQAVASGREALAEIANSSASIDLVITDRDIPGGVFGENVVNVVEAAKQQGMKAILMSAEDLNRLAVTAAVSGADRILPKPFGDDKLKRLIEELFCE